MSASPKFYRNTEVPAFSPSCATQLPLPLVFVGSGGSGDDDYCRTPTGSRIAYLREATTCPPAPRKPPALTCRKRLFQFQGADQPTAEAALVTLISLRLDELQRLFCPHPPPTTTTDKRHRSSSVSVSISGSATKHGHLDTQLRNLN